MDLIKKGNAKINKKCNVFNLPTSVCVTSCKNCYARKAEKRFPAVWSYREANYLASLRDNFEIRIHVDITKSKNTMFRIHESGDFYSQDYINKWTRIIKNWPHVKFYAYTKAKDRFDFKELENLSNMNLINSNTPLGVNYGDASYCNELVRLGYYLCSCDRGVHIDCMGECTECLTKDRVCFLQH